MELGDTPHPEASLRPDPGPPQADTSSVIPAKAGIQREAKPADYISMPAFDTAVLGEEERRLGDTRKWGTSRDWGEGTPTAGAVQLPDDR